MSSTGDPSTSEGCTSRLRRLSLLAEAPEGVLEQMRVRGQERTYQRGEWLFQEGSLCANIQWVLAGAVEIVKADGAEGFVLGRVPAGECLGEMSFLERLPRSASARAAVDDTRVFELPAEDFTELLQEAPTLCLEVAKDLSQRLRTGNAELLRQYTELAAAHQRLRRGYEGTLLALSGALDLRDRETEGHSERVTAISLLIGRAMGLNEPALEALRLGALLHDIGKIGITDAILHKAGHLTTEEWERMRQHPVWGKRLIENIDFLAGAADVVYGHHERWDGQGYPQGLCGDRIPLHARIFAVADVFDALTRARPYKPPWPLEQARAEITRNSGLQFDPEVVRAFQAVFPQIVEVWEKWGPADTAAAK